ncbi:MAG TPA: hypothetical protein VEQ60_02810 [Longimicrobium sp.]|nr:hypothetical protein [Longimicrobium sp.]
MKRKLRIDDLSVTSFSTDANRQEQGTVRGHNQDISFGTCPGEPTCDSCNNLRTCADTCQCSVNTCPRQTCYFTCYNTCPY